VFAEDRNWSEVRARKEVVVDGICCSLTHLQDTEYRLRIPASGKYPELAIVLFVIFSSHCISWGPSLGEQVDFSVMGEDRRIIDEQGIHRCFDPIRYALSLHLPRIFKTFAERECLFTGRRNWLTVEVLDAAGKPQEYEIFFRIFRQSSRVLRIFVDSAYVRDPHRSYKQPTPPMRRAKISAKVLMAKTLRGESVKRPAEGRRGKRQKAKSPMEGLFAAGCSWLSQHGCDRVSPAASGYRT